MSALRLASDCALPCLNSCNCLPQQEAASLQAVQMCAQMCARLPRLCPCNMARSTGIVDMSVDMSTQAILTPAEAVRMTDVSSSVPYVRFVCLQAEGPYRVTVANRQYHASRHIVNADQIAGKIKALEQVSTCR